MSTTALSMSGAGLALLVIGLFAAKNDTARARGIDKIATLTYLCFAIPLAVFGAEHLAMGKLMQGAVPPYMPFRLFWIYFVGVALIAASLSIATKIRVQWSGLLFGAMMLSFVAMIHLPLAVKGGGRSRGPLSSGKCRSVEAGGSWRALRWAVRGAGSGTVGRVLIAITAIFFGVQHFLHPLGLPGVPLQKGMPLWVPAREIIDYLTGALLIIAGVCFLLGRWTRDAAAYLGAWIVFLVVVIYGPVLFGALGSSSSDVQVEGLNYFADTLLFGAVILSVARASATRPTDG